MAQVDTVSYIPSLFWFVINFIILYLLITTYILPILYSILKTRFLFLNKLEFILLFIDNILIKFSLLIKLVYKNLFNYKLFLYTNFLVLIIKTKLKF